MAAMKVVKQSSKVKTVPIPPAVNTIDSLTSFKALETLIPNMVHDVNDSLGTALAAVQISLRKTRGSGDELEKWLNHAADSIRQAATATKRVAILCNPDDATKLSSTSNLTVSHADLDERLSEAKP